MRRLVVGCLLLGACAPNAVVVSTAGPSHTRFRDYPDPAPTTTAVAPTTTTEAPTPTTVPLRPHTQPTAASRGASRGGLNWEALRDCESGGDYSTNTGNGYFGAYQFSLPTWRIVGGDGLPSDASPEEQDMRAQMLYDRSGPGQWPQCGRLL